MKILVVAESLPSPGNPEAGRFNELHAQALARWADVTVAHLRYASRAQSRSIVNEVSSGRIVVTIPGSKIGRQLSSADVVADLASEFDAVHSMALETLMACRFLPRRDIAWVHSEHAQNFTDPVGGPGERLWLSAVQRSIRRPLLVTAVSSYLQAGIRRAGRTGLTEVVPNVIEAGPARLKTPTSGTTRILSVGRLVPSKQPVMALQVLSILRGDGMDVDLTWIGDGDLRDAVMQEAARLDVLEHFRIIPFMPAQQYLQMIADFDLFLLPTLYETFCVTAAEAIAGGIPVVIGDNGGQADFVGPDNGVLIPARGPAAEYVRGIRAVLELTPAIPTPTAVKELTSSHDLDSISARFQEVYRLAGLL